MWQLCVADVARPVIQEQVEEPRGRTQRLRKAQKEEENRTLFVDGKLRPSVGIPGAICEIVPLEPSCTDSLLMWIGLRFSSFGEQIVSCLGGNALTCRPGRDAQCTVVGSWVQDPTLLWKVGLTNEVAGEGNRVWKTN